MQDWQGFKIKVRNHLAIIKRTRTRIQNILKKIAGNQNIKAADIEVLLFSQNVTLSTVPSGYKL